LLALPSLAGTTVASPATWNSGAGTTRQYRSSPPKVEAAQEKNAKKNSLKNSEHKHSAPASRFAFFGSIPDFLL
jgi:hypothetical protein